MRQLDEIRERAISRARWANSVRAPWINGGGEQGEKLQTVFSRLREAEADLGSLLMRAKKLLGRGDTDTSLVETPTPCPDCHVAAGYTHHENCDVERCSSCGLQRMGCSCVDHDPKQSFWTGYWPGDEATRLLNVNHNELAGIVSAAKHKVSHTIPGPH